MTANVRIVFKNDSDDATITASPSMVTNLDETNLQKQPRSKVARTSSLASQQLFLSWGGDAKVVNTWALGRHNFTVSGGIRVRLYDGDNQTGSVVYDSGVLPPLPSIGWGTWNWGAVPWGQAGIPVGENAITYDWFTTVEIKSGLIDWNDSVNGDNYMQAGRFFLGLSAEPAINANYGVSISWPEETVQIRTEGNTLRSDGRLPYKRMSFDFSNLNEADRQTFTRNARDNGLRKDAFIAVFPDEGSIREYDYLMIGKLVQTPEFIHHFPTLYSVKMIFEES